MNNSFFPERTKANPIIYAYSDSKFPNMLKVGFTSRSIEERMKEHYPTLVPGEKLPYKVELVESAMYFDGGNFTDHDVHRVLENKNIHRQKDRAGKKTEWFKCTVQDIKAAVIAVRNKTENIENRTQTFSMREEQRRAVNKTYEYFVNAKNERPDIKPKFLWNAKMRFGKTFTSYQLAKKMNLQKILILTFKPAVQSAWKEDLLSHVDFEGWQFISNFGNTENINVQFEKADKNRPIVCFGSFQDFLGTNENGGIKAKNEWVHTTNWDLVIFDEYHFGAWHDNAKKLFELEDEDTIYNSNQNDSKSSEEKNNAIDESWLPITTEYYLFLSGTPFRALHSGEFIEDQIFSWTYSDEQNAKETWGKTPKSNDWTISENTPSYKPKKNLENPYAALARMVLMTYKIPDEITSIAQGGEFDEFDLNEFFLAEGKGDNAIFKYENYVQKWLDLIRGSYLPGSVTELKLGVERPPLPFSDVRLLENLSHTLWFLPNVASCYAMKNLLSKKQNSFYSDYKIIVCAGTGAGIGVNALPPVLQAMENPLKTKTITLTCGKLTTGVTVKPWTGIFMLRNLSSPETYFQSAFRVQSPWVITKDNGESEIVKKECYVFDFALNRALRQISDYARNLDTKQTNPEGKVADFISFLPVLAYDGSSMRQVNAAEILDIAMAGTSATLLAKRWESALLVNVDNDTLKRLMNNQEAMNALMSIEGFRSLNSEIETIINKSEKIKEAKKNKDKELSQKEKRELSEEEKEYKSMRKQIQEKLIKFATRIPVFMYLSDYREYSLSDVIRQLEPELFKKVTGLTVKDFNLLVSLNVFNESLMNDAVYKFKRYEDASLSYTGINRHEGEKVGLYNTVLSKEDFELLAKIQKQSV